MSPDIPAVMVSDQDFSTAQLYFSKMPLVLRPLAYTQQVLQQGTHNSHALQMQQNCRLHTGMHTSTHCIAFWTL